MTAIEVERIERFIIPVVSFILLFLPIFYFLLFKGFELFVFLFFFAFPIVLIFLKLPKIWCYFVTLSFAVFLIYRGKDDQVDVLEIAFALLVIPGLIYFFIHKLFVEKKQIIQNYGDLFILLFFIFLPFNGLIAFLNDVDIFRWVREISILILLLFYFPLREYIKSEKELGILLLCALIAVFSSIGYLIYHYRETTLVTASYAYELVFGLGAKVKINHTVFTAAYFTSIILFVTRKNLLLRVIVFLTAFASLVALIVTVSRTFWIVVLLGTIVLFIYYGWKERLRILFFYFVIAISTLGVIYWTFGSNYKLVTRLIEYRFLTSTQGKKDKSVMGRLAEYPVVLRGIAENPLWGNGFAKKIRFRDPIFVRTSTSHNIHNGFTSMLFRAGIPLALFYISFFIYYFFKSFRLILATKRHYLQPYVLSGFIILIILFVSQFTNQQFLFRDFNFSAFIAIAMIEFVNRNYKRILS
ncbi:MAG: O-antigen ligase family protein [Ignavibacteria bacterium]|nr:O-antigen ligase family protein [Ignavibacteria bacterium]